MVIYTTASSDRDLTGILELQKKNLPAHLPQEEIDSQGFVTVNHSPGELQQLHAIEPSLIVKDGDKIVPLMPTSALGSGPYILMQYQVAMSGILCFGPGKQCDR